MLPDTFPVSDEAARLQAAVSVARLGTFEWNLRTQQMRLDARSREIFGFAEGEGTSDVEVFSRIHPSDIEWVQSYTIGRLERGERVDIEYRLQLPGGAIRHVASSGSILQGADGARDTVFGVFADVTERQWNQIRAQVLLDLSERLDRAADGREARYVAAEVLGNALGLARVAYGVVEDAPDCVRIERDWAAPGVPSAAGRYPLADYGPFIGRLAAGEVIAIADAARDPRPAQAVEAVPVRTGFAAAAVLLLPILEQGALVAILFLDHARRREWLPREIDLVREVAERVRDSSERKRVEQALRDSENRHAFLVQLGDRLRSLHDPVDMQRAAAELLGTRIAAQRAWYCEYETPARRGVVQADYAAGSARSLAGVYRTGEFPSLHARLAHGEAVLIADTSGPSVLEPCEQAKLHAFGLGSFMCIPLLKRGELVAALAVAQPTPHPWTELEHAMAQDTAERTWAALERGRAEAALRAADRRKDEFLATLAHELRNPLAPLRNGLQIARLTARGDATLQRTVEMMDRQLTHLVRLVDDLLDVGRISSGKLQLRREPVSLARVLASSLEATQVLMDRHGHHVTADLQAADLRVSGDFDRLSQVFVNLLSNAAKYTEKGGRIGLQLRREGGEAVVTVSDTGIGIPGDQLQQVFDLFSQVRTHQGRTEGGLGIGLALVKSLVAMHGGSVVAHSAGPGLGSAFTVRLPLLQQETVVDAPAQDAAPPPASRAHRILVADDNADAAATLATLLQIYGHEVWCAEDGVAAVELAREVQPDLVFLDLGMPRMGGIEAARKLREEGLPAQAKLIALTGWGQEADRRRTREAGFDWHLVKPVEMAVLNDILARVDGGVDNTAP